MNIAEPSFAYWDRECDIAWIRTRSTATDVCEEMPWGLVDLDETGKVTGFEIWDASTVLPPDMLERMPSPGRPDKVAA
jgi:uncharacterized protein YuzE